MNLKSFEDVYSIIMDFARSNTTVKYDFHKLNVTDIDLSNNPMTYFMKIDKDKKYKKLT